VFSLFGDDKYFRYAGPSADNGLDKNNLIRFVPAPQQSARNQSGLFNYLEPNQNRMRVNSLAINGVYPGTESSASIPGERSNLVIYDYSPVYETRSSNIRTYMIAGDRDTDRIHLYVTPDAAKTQLFTLPGYVTADSKIAGTETALYLYTGGTCT
jgi:hypothetical protein